MPRCQPGWWPPWTPESARAEAATIVMSRRVDSWTRIIRVTLLAAVLLHDLSARGRLVTGRGATGFGVAGRRFFSFEAVADHLVQADIGANSSSTSPRDPSSEPNGTPNGETGLAGPGPDSGPST